MLRAVDGVTVEGDTNSVKYEKQCQKKSIFIYGTTKERNSISKYIKGKGLVIPSVNGIPNWNTLI